MTKDLIRQFERLLEDVRDMFDRQEAWMERQDPLPGNLCRGIPNARRQGRMEPRVENHVEYW